MEDVATRAGVAKGTGAAGKPALEVQRILAFGGHSTDFNLADSVREPLARGFNIGLQASVVEMDGAAAPDWRSAEKRGKLDANRSSSKPAL